MPRRKVFDKKNATTFSLVHRAQNDPLIHDEDAPSMVFAEKRTSRRPTADDYAYSTTGSMVSDTSYQSTKTKQRNDLEAEFGSTFKPNEGEAAQHGIFFDDTQYDYMQHMRDLGAGGGSTWLDSSTAQNEKGKGKMKLEDSLRDLDLGSTRSIDEQSMGASSIASSARSLLPDEILPSEFVKKRTYQDQQNIPDDIAGFQPDMDPRLRETLEALDDEEYVDDDEDVFGQLTSDGYEVERDEWDRLGEQQLFDDEDEGWESDDTIKAAERSHSPTQVILSLGDGENAAPPEDVQAQPPADPTEGAWIDEFAKFKSDAKAAKQNKAVENAQAPSTMQSSVLSSLASGRRKKRKGAQTSTSNYSMSSSVLVRTDQQTLLDSRFDKIEEAYLEDEMLDEDDHLADEMSMTSGMTGMSKASKVSRYSNVSGLSGVSGISSYSRHTDAEAPTLERGDFNSIMDEFLGDYSTAGKANRRVRRGKPQTGMEQLDEIRSGLGPVRFKSTARAS